MTTNEQLKALAEAAKNSSSLATKEYRAFSTFATPERILALIAENERLAHSRKDAEPVGWKCFHCGEVFTTKLEGLKHFGSSERQDPACTIDVLQYRAMEALIERYVDEDTDLHRSMGKMRSDHETALRREEEAGYARGLADGQKLCVKESCYSPTPARQEDQRDTHPPEADKLLQQALESFDAILYWRKGDVSTERTVESIRTYLENKA